MGLFSKFTAVGAGRRLAKKNAPTVHKGVDAVASTVAGRVPDRHRSAVGKGASLVKRVLTGSTGTQSSDAPGAPPAR